MKNKSIGRCLGCLLLMSFMWLNVSAQNRTVTGVVTDAGREPLSGVSILLKGTSTGTISDVDGNYSLQLPAGNQVLVFSYTGFSKQEITPGTRNIINVVLEEDSKLLDEVVVVGYGQTRKRDLTGAVAQLRPTDEESQLFTSVDNLLQGKIAGLAVTNSGSTPGGAVSVQIRGANSLRSDNQPLYVIDNIPMASTAEVAGNSIGDFQMAQNPLTSLNPQDIESIEVLKDASAAAIYGARGANGVILITTKKGKQGKTTINANINLSIANATRLPDMLGLVDYANYRNEQGGNQQYFFEGDEIRYISSGGSYDPANPESYSVLQEVNWLDETFRQAFSQNYNVSVNGGGEKMTYYFSGGYKNIEGLVKNTGLSQGDLRLNLNSQLNDNLRLFLNLNGSMKQNDMMSGGDTKGGPSGSILISAINAAPHQKVIDANTQPEDRSTALSWINDYDDIAISNTFRGSLSLNWKISPVFSYELRSGGNIRYEDRDRWFGLQLFRGMNDNGVLSSSKIKANNYSVDNLLNFDTKLASFVRMNGVVGVSYEDYNFLNSLVTGKDFYYHALRTKGMAYAADVAISEPIQRDYQLGSYLGRVNFSAYDGRYLLTASFRADGSSKFSGKNKWGYFPSLSAAWRLEEEQFMKSADWLSQLKLRMGWGITGNQGIDPYSTLAGYSRLLDYSDVNGNKELALGVNKIPNEGLKWETTEAYNLGLDFGILKQRLSGSVDVYLKKTRDLLIDLPLGLSAGFTSMSVNQGDIENKGIEVSLTGVIFDKKDFGWTVSGNIGLNRSEIVNLGLQPGTFGNHQLTAYLGRSIGDYWNAVNIYAVGHAPGMFWGYKTDGIIQSDEEVAHITYEKGNKQVGNVKLVDLDGDNIISEKDMTFIGDPNPDFTYGFQTAFNYKRLTLSASFNGVYGRDVYNSNKFYDQTPARGTNNIRTDAYRNAWRGEGTSNTYSSPQSTLPRLSMDYFVEDASFLRLSDLTIAYALPAQWIKSLRLTKAQVFVTGKNLFVITDYSGFDPEVNSFPNDGLRMGVDMNSFPNPREFMLGINLSF